MVKFHMFILRKQELFLPLILHSTVWNPNMELQMLSVTEVLNLTFFFCRNNWLYLSCTTF